MKKALLTLSISILTLIAFANVASASTMVAFQPELPEQLKDR